MTIIESVLPYYMSGKMVRIFTPIMTLNTCNNSIIQASLSYPLYRWGNWDYEFPKIYIARSRNRSWIHFLCFCTVPDLLPILYKNELAVFKTHEYKYPKKNIKYSRWRVQNWFFFLWTHTAAMHQRTECVWLSLTIDSGHIFNLQNKCLSQSVFLTF